MLIRNYGETQPHPTPRRVCRPTSSVPNYRVWIWYVYTAVPTRLQLPSRPRRVRCHTPPRTTMCNDVLPCRICCRVTHSEL